MLEGDGVEYTNPTDLSRRTAEALDGGETVGRLRGPAFVRPSHGLVRPVDVEAGDVVLALADVLALATPGCVIGGWASLRLQGNTWFDGLDRQGRRRPALVHCPPGAQMRSRPELVRPFRGLTHPDEVIDLEGVRVTTPARAVFDEMRLARGLREAVVALDMAVSTTHRMPHTSLAAVARVVSHHHKTRGLVQARRALELGTSRSASPWETRTRLVAADDAGVTDLQVNVPVFDLHEHLLGVADLLDERAGLVIESDGGHHREAERHTEDNRREEGFERHGMVVCRVTALDHGARWDTAGRIAAAHRDARASTKRLWTTDQPAWWRTWEPARRWD